MKNPRKRSKWASTVKMDIMTPEQICNPLLQALNEAVLHVELLLPSVVALGTSLLSVRCKQKDRPSGKEFEDAEPAALVGKQLLVDTFDGHKGARAAIIDHCVQHLASAKPAEVKHHLLLLSSLSNSCYDKIIPELSKLAEGLEQLLVINPENAFSMMVAMKPLLSRREICDRAWMVLRKVALYRHQGCRASAIRGMLLLALETHTAHASETTEAGQLEQPCSSQAGPSQQRNQTTSSFLVEALGFLRRFLNQQAGVRRVLYSSLKSTCLVNRTTAPYVCQILQQALSRSIHTADASYAKVDLQVNHLS